MATVERFYFEPGFSLRATGAGDEVRLLDRFRNIFSVAVTARENWIELSGETDDIRRALAADFADILLDPTPRATREN